MLFRSVDFSLIVMAAFGSTAPPWSVIVPEIVPRLVCETLDIASAMITNSGDQTLLAQSRLMLIVIGPSLLACFVRNASSREKRDGNVLGCADVLPNTGEMGCL